MEYKQHSKCRACGNESLIKYLDLGLMPMSNDLAEKKDEAINAKRYPLEVLSCSQCTLSQLSVVIDPALHYSYYTYRSSMSQTYKDHCLAMAKKIKTILKVDGRFTALDIAGNDGALSVEFRKVFDCMSLVVDPASNLLQYAQNSGCAIYKGFWGKEVAKTLLDTEVRIGRFSDGARLITSTNVIAHVDDLDDFFAGVKWYLHHEGIYIIEVPHILSYLNNAEFDTTYFEHLSYFSLTALKKILARHTLQIFGVESVPIHGGTMRVWVCHPAKYRVSENVEKWYRMEESLSESTIYNQFVSSMDMKLEKIMESLEAYKKTGKKVVGFGASAKGNILLNLMHKSLLPEYIIDETPEKIGMFSPGIGLHIKPLTHDWWGIDVVMILAWNFREEIERKLRYYGFEGEIYCPL